jgi:hypothetical protein
MFDTAISCRCIEFIKLYTNKGKSLSFGNKKSTALFQTVAAPVGGWLAALKGEHDLEMRDGKRVGATVSYELVIQAAQCLNDCYLKWLLNMKI